MPVLVVLVDENMRLLQVRRRLDLRFWLVRAEAPSRRRNRSNNNRSRGIPWLALRLC